MKTAVFATRQEALNIVATLVKGTYYLAHGEHSRPEYKVRKVRGGEGYEIYAKRHYYAGTLHARPSGALTWESNELYSL